MEVNDDLADGLIKLAKLKKVRIYQNKLPLVSALH
jgi:hypothetical protein